MAAELELETRLIVFPVDACSGPLGGAEVLLNRPNPESYFEHLPYIESDRIDCCVFSLNILSGYLLCSPCQGASLTLPSRDRNVRNTVYSKSEVLT